MRRISYILILIIATHVASAQTDVSEALRFSQLTYGSSARTLGVGGAFGAVGADVSATSINPAGVGLFRSSEFTVSGSLLFNSSNATYIGQSSNEIAGNFNVGNWGAVFVIPTKRADNPWRSVNLSVNTDRLANYDKQTSFSGYNTNNSYVDALVQQLNSANVNTGVAPSQLASNPNYFYGFLANQGYLLFPNSGADSLHYSSNVPHGQVNQSYLNTTTGFLRETNATISANYKDRLYLGFSMGFTHINYTSTTTYSEKTATGQPSSTGFKDFTQTDYVSTSGWGYNAKLGAVVRLSDMFRVGLSFQTPTLFKLSDYYSDNIKSDVNRTTIDSTTMSYNYHDYTPQDGQYNYQLITPWHATLSGAMIIPRYGFISVDYEYVPYNSASYNFNQAASTDDKAQQTIINNTISSSFVGASNVRVGTEYAVKDYRFRLGAAYYMSPYSSSVKPSGGYDDSRILFTAGAGINFSQSHLDLALAYQMYNTYLQPSATCD